MKILQAIPSVDESDGGPTVALQAIRSSLIEAEHDVTVATTKRSRSPEPADGFVFAQRLTEAYKFAPSLLVWLFRNTRNYDVVHIHALFSFSSSAAALCAWWFNVPYIVRPLGTINEYGMSQRRWLKKMSFALVERQILGHASTVHFTARAEQRESVSVRHSTVVPLGIEAVSDDVPAPLERDHDRPAILFLSRLDPKKNLEGLLRAMPTIKDRHATVQLIVAGQGESEYLASLLSLSEELGLADCVRWTGFVKGVEKQALFKRADVFVLPSFSENFGIVVTEAMSFSVPCVLSSGVALADDLRQHDAGLVSETDPEGIANAISLLLDDEALRDRIASNGRDLFLKHYTADAMGRNLIAMYQHAMKRHAAI